jgi:hypothetical protein
MKQIVDTSIFKKKKGKYISDYVQVQYSLLKQADVAGGSSKTHGQPST